MQESISQRAITEAEAHPARTVAPSQGEPRLSVQPRRAPTAPSPWRRPWVWISVLVVIAAVVAFAMIRRTQSGAQTGTETQRTARVEKKDFIHSVRVAGTVEAVESHSISAPRLAGQTSGQLTITKLLLTGTHVHKGDLLVEFDRQVQVRNAQDREADYNDFLRQIDKLRATQDAARAVDDADLKAQVDLVRNAELEVKRSEVQSQIQAEKNKENLDEANAKVKQLRDTYDLKRISDKAALHVLEIQRDSSRLAMQHARDNSEKLAIKSPADGLVVINSTFQSSGIRDWQEGDDIGPGGPLLQVVNPNSMRVRASVNQQDIPEITEGQRVSIRLDAYPDLVFQGRADQVTAIGVQGNFSPKVHTFTVLFMIEGANPNLLPDLSAAVDVELERTPNVLVVPRDTLIHRDSKTFVRVVNGSSSQEREVKVSKMDDADAVIASGINAGDTLLRGTETSAPSPAMQAVSTAHN